MGRKSPKSCLNTKFCQLLSPSELWRRKARDTVQDDLRNNVLSSHCPTGEWTAWECGELPRHWRCPNTDQPLALDTSYPYPAHSTITASSVKPYWVEQESLPGDAVGGSDNTEVGHLGSHPGFAPV